MLGICAGIGCASFRTRMPRSCAMQEPCPSKAPISQRAAGGPWGGFASQNQRPRMLSIPCLASSPSLAFGGPRSPEPTRRRAAKAGGPSSNFGGLLGCAVCRRSCLQPVTVRTWCRLIPLAARHLGLRREGLHLSRCPFLVRWCRHIRASSS